MERVDLKEYLGQIVSLESSIYSQEAIYEKAKRTLTVIMPKQTSAPKPKKPNLEIVNKPFMEEPVYLTGERFAHKLFPVLVVVFGILGFMLLKVGRPDVAVFSFIMAPAMFAGWKALHSSIKKRREATTLKNKMKMEQYHKEQVAAEQAYKKAMAKYEKDMQAYPEKVQAAEEKYKQKNAIAEQNDKACKQAINNIRNGLSKTKKVLAELYALDVVFPKYRNLIAMCTIYEYIVSGRCTELEGPNGAYNLFEAELRQNLIINQLDKINKNLEHIKANQYMLYQEMTRANVLLDKISGEMSKISKTTQEIKEISAVTAHCASVTAKSTEALKYLALIK